MSEDVFDFGECCACLGRQNVRNLVMHPKRAPVPGTGWGCVVCGLLLDGAISVICDACAAAGGGTIVAVCYGRVADNKRIAIDTLSPEPFDHDMQLHVEDDVS